MVALQEFSPKTRLTSAEIWHKVGIGDFIRSISARWQVFVYIFKER